MNLINQIKKQAEKLFINSKGSHDWEHTVRVYDLCLRIGKKEKANMEILQIAAWLHDIGRESQDKSNGKICHAEKSAILARKLLNDFKVDNEKIDKIAHCIETHRYRNNKTPNSKEAKILFDADKLDSIGAVGIGRAFLFAGEIGAKLHNNKININDTKAYSVEDTAYREYMVKLRKVKDKIMTKDGIAIAKERHHFMVEFFDRLNKEVDGEM